MTPVALIARKEAGELLMGGRGIAWLLAMAIALSAFALLLVSDTELSLLDNAQVVYDMVPLRRFHRPRETGCAIRARPAGCRRHSVTAPNSIIPAVAPSVSRCVY